MLFLQSKSLLIVLEEIRPDGGLKQAGTCRLIDFILVLYVAVLLRNAYLLIT